MPTRRLRPSRASGLVNSGVLLLIGALVIPSCRFDQEPRLGSTSSEGAEQPSSDVTLADVMGRKVDFVVDYFGLRYGGNTGNYIDANVYYYGAFERPELYFVRDALTSLPPRRVFIDVGANTGLYAVFASKYANTVHAFEPFPPVLQKLRALVADNGLSNVVVHPVGLGAEKAQLPFMSPREDNLGTGSFLPGFKEFQPANRNDHLTLPIEAGDVYFRSVGITRVDFIKMDIEGYEKAAITGLRETLRRNRPVVLIETSVDPNVPDIFKSMDDVKRAFPESYDFCVIDSVNKSTGAYRLQAIRSTFAQQEQFNLVAWPSEKRSLIPQESAGDSAPVTPSSNPGAVNHPC